MKPWLKNRLRTSAYQNIFQELRLNFIIYPVILMLLYFLFIRMFLNFH